MMWLFLASRVTQICFCSLGSRNMDTRVPGSAGPGALQAAAGRRAANVD